METKKNNRPSFGRRRLPGDGYDADCRRLREGWFAGVFSRFRPGVASVMRTKMKLASFCENFFLTKMLARFARHFLKTKVRSSSVGILCFGFLCAAITLLLLFMEQITPSTAVTDLAFSLGVVLGTLPLSLSRSTWGGVLSRSLLGRIVFDLLGGFREDELNGEGEYFHGGRFSVVVGVLLGLLCFFVSPAVLSSLFLLPWALALIFYKPEFGLSLLALLFAFLSPEALLFLSFCVLLSFVWKVARGKRVIEWEPVDLFALFFFLIWVCGSGPDFQHGNAVIVGAVLYFLFSKLVTTSAQARRLSYVFVIGLFLFSALFFVRVWAGEGHGDLAVRIGDLLFREEGGFVVPLDLVMMLLPIAAVGAVEKGGAKFFSVASLALGLCTLLFSQSPGALFCLALSLAALAVILGKRMIPVYLCLSVVLAVLAFFYRSVFSDLVSNVPALLSNVLGEQERILAEIFSRDWATILLGSVSPAASSLNFWGDFLYRFGLVGVSLFVLFLVYLFRKAMGVWACTKEANLLRLCFGLQLAVAVLLLRGITSSFTVDASVFGFFWLVCGMLCGVRNVTKAACRREQC